jgi:hypothetical protein
LAADAFGQGLDDLAQRRADHVGVVGRGGLPVEDRHHQAQRLRLREHHRRQARTAAQSVSAVGAADRFDGYARLPQDLHVAAHRPRCDPEFVGELLGGGAGAHLKDLQGTQRPRSGAQVGRHGPRLDNVGENRK